MIGLFMPYYGLPYPHVISPTSTWNCLKAKFSSVLQLSNYLVEKCVLIDKTSVTTTNNYPS